MRRLTPGSRLGGTILSAIGLLGFPVGTIVNAYVLYLLRSHKGTVVFSEEYRDVIAATPHIKYKTPVWVWIILGLVILGVVAAIIGAAS